MEENLFDVVVVGSGPAGLTAAIYAARGAARTVVLAGEKWGGQLMLTTLVENYPGFPEGIQGPDLMDRMKQQAVACGALFVPQNVTQVDFSKKPFVLTTSDHQYLGKTVIVATGAETVWLDVPGVEQLIGKGVSSCAPCDAPFFKDKKVAVIGGGDTAMEEALTLTKFASMVFIIHRREEFRASPAMQAKVLNHPKIKILWNTEVSEVVGGSKVTSITVKNNQTGKKSNMDVDGVFMAIGHKPVSEIFRNQLEVDERGFIKVNRPHSVTGISGVFVAGDVFDRYYKQAVTAAGSGCAAALEALDFLREKES